jgi:hypothetical protein
VSSSIHAPPFEAASRRLHAAKAAHVPERDGDGVMHDTFHCLAIFMRTTIRFGEELIGETESEKVMGGQLQVTRECVNVVSTEYRGGSFGPDNREDRVLQHQHFVTGRKCKGTS